MSMQKNFTQNDPFVSALPSKNPTFAGSRTIQEWFFLLLLITVGAIGFFYVMNNSNPKAQGFSKPAKTEQITKAGFFVGN